MGKYLVDYQEFNMPYMDGGAPAAWYVQGNGEPLTRVIQNAIHEPNGRGAAGLVCRGERSGSGGRAGECSGSGGPSGEAWETARG
jgi:hypothetical protein